MDAKVQKMVAECDHLEHALGMLNLDIQKTEERNCLVKDNTRQMQEAEHKIGADLLDLRKEKEDTLHAIQLEDNELHHEYSCIAVKKQEMSETQHEIGELDKKTLLQKQHNCQLNETNLGLLEKAEQEDMKNKNFKYRNNLITKEVDEFVKQSDSIV